MASTGGDSSVGEIKVRITTLYESQKLTKAKGDIEKLSKSARDATSDLTKFQGRLEKVDNSLDAFGISAHNAASRITFLSEALATSSGVAKTASGSFATSATAIGRYNKALLATSGINASASKGMANTNAQITQTNKSVSQLGRTWQLLGSGLFLPPSYTNGLKGANDELGKTTTQSKKVNTELGNTSKQSLLASSSVGKFRHSMAMVGKSVSMTGKSITYGTLPMAMIGIASANMAEEFGTNMNRMVSLANISMKDMEAMKTPILDMASTYGVVGTEAADAAYYIASSGFDASQTLGILKTSLMASKIGMGEVKDVADLLTSAISAYGKENLSAARAGDIMQAAVAAGKFEADEMAKVMGSVIPIASELDISFADTAATLAIMSRTGTDAYKGATQLRGIMSALLKPSVQGSEALKKVGLSAEIVRNKITKDGLYAGLIMLKQGLGDNKEALAKVFPNVRGLAGFLNVMGKQAKYSGKIYKDVNKEANQLATSVKKVQERPEEKYKTAIVSFKNEMIKLGAILIPVFTKIITKVTGLFNSFNKLPKPQKDLIVNIAMIAAVFGPFLVILGAAIQTIAMLMYVVQGLSAVFGAFSLTGLGIGAAIIALIAITYLLIKNWDSVKSALSATWNWIKGAISDVGQFFADKAREGFLGPVPWIIANWKGIINFFKGAWNWIKNAVSDVGQFFANAAQEGFLGPIPWIIANWNKIVKFFKSIPGKIKNGLLKLAEFVSRPFKVGVDKIESILDGIVSAFESAVNAVKSVIDGVGGVFGFIGGLNPLASGGIANPGNYAIVGDSPKPEFVISQTGPRDKNLGLLSMAANALNVPMFADGGMTTKKVKVISNPLGDDNNGGSIEIDPNTGKRIPKKKGNKGGKGGKGGGGNDDTGPTPAELREAARKKREAARKRREAKQQRLADQTSNFEENYRYYDRKFRSDQIIDRSELRSLLGLKDKVITSIKSERNMVKPGSADWKSFSMDIKNHELDKKDLVREFKQAAKERRKEAKEARLAKKKAREEKRNELTKNQLSYFEERYSYLERKARMDSQISQEELDQLISFKNKQINNIKKQQKRTKKGSLEWKSFQTKIDNLVLDKAELKQEFLEQETAKQGDMGSQISEFNQARFAVLSSFGGNIRARSAVPTVARAGGYGTQAAGAPGDRTQPTSGGAQKITINQEFKERPQDPHVWTRNIQNEIAALI